MVAVTTLSRNPIAAAAQSARRLEQPAFISLLDDDLVADLATAAPDGPLAGVTFAVKDNIDVAGVATTAACPARDEPAVTDAAAVRRLRGAGAVPIGKTNMDQFATGLVGTRSPYGACHSVLVPDRVSGGSSSGSAVAVAAGVVPLALGTDTAGSGRVPAAFNGLVGVKPTRGLVSTRGLFPACRSLDCITTMTSTVSEARRALDVIAGFDPADPWSREAPQLLPPGVASSFTTVGVPAGELDLDDEFRVPWQAAVDRLRGLGLRVVPVDVEPFLQAARLLYGGPWVAERQAAFGAWLRADQPYVDPTVRAVVMGRDVTGADVFDGLDRLAVLRRCSERVWVDIDALLLPVAPAHPTPAAVAADPIGVNTRLGTYTNFVNLLDLCAVAVPAARDPQAPPFGVQLIAPAFADRPLLDLAARWCGEPAMPVTEDDGSCEVVVAGAHLTGQPLNSRLTARGGRLLRRARTSAGYRMLRVPGTGVSKPALVLGDGPDDGFPVEVWQMPHAAVGALATELPAELHLGQVLLGDGSRCLGYVGDPAALADATDISGHGGWRGYLATLSAG